MVAAISTPMVFLKLSAIDKTILSTASEVLLPRFEGIKPPQLFDRTQLFYSFINEWGRNSCMHLNLGEIQALKSSLTGLGLRFSISLAKKP